MHQGELNRLHPISGSSCSSAYFFTIYGVNYEGQEEVVSRERLTLVIYFSK